MKILIILALALMLLGCTGHVVKEDKLTFGALMPLTGPNSGSFGQYAFWGLTLAVEEINDNGGNVDFIVEDSMAEGRQAINAFNSLVARDVPVVIGDISVVSLYVAPFAEESETVLLAPGSAVPSLRNAGDYVFRVKVAGDVEAFESAEGLIGLGINSTAVFVKNSDYGVGIGNAYVEKFSELGGTVVGYEKYDTGSHDYRTNLLKIKDAESIFLVCHPEECGLIVKQARELRLDVPLVINPSSWGPEVLDIAGKATDGIYSFHEVDLDLSTDFRLKFVKKFGEEPTLHSYLAYDATYIVVNLLKKCSADSTCIKDELYDVDYLGSSGRIGFDSNGDVIREGMIMKLFQDGEFVKI
jgi:branched-chain amino acid transport system substrate-binding protein